MPSWIKLRDDLDTDPRVFAMADQLRQSACLYILTSQAKDLFGSVTEAVTRHVMRDVTLAGLSRVWFAANRHTTDGIFRNATLDYLDTLAQVPGFGAAMQLVGYALYDPVTRTVTLPRFTEYNAPDKNGERSKTAAARRQQRLRERKKAMEESLAAAAEEAASMPVTPVNPAPSSAPNTPIVTSRVTPSVTPSVTPCHDENNVTPSLSYSSSISESDSDSDRDTSRPPPPDPLGQLKTRINALRPKAWAKAPHWSAEDEQALYDARQNLQSLDDQDWHLLDWFFRWANSAANTGQRDPVKVTTRRHQFCRELAAYLDRATTAWKQAGAPKLGPPAAAPAKAPTPPPPTPTPEETHSNAAAFASLVADLRLQPPHPPKEAAA